MRLTSTLIGFLGFGLLFPQQKVSAAGGNDKRSPLENLPDLAKITPDPGLKEVEVLRDERLEDVTSIVTSRDGRHAYAAAYNPGSVSILDRNPDTGGLTLRENLSGDDHNGAVAFRLSSDETLGATSCFRANSLILYARDPESGDLEKLDVAGGPGKAQDTLRFCTDNVFSPDGRHLYSVSSSTIGVFSIEENRLVEKPSAEKPPALKPAEEGGREISPMRGGRGIAISPNGRQVFAAWNSSGALTVHNRDPETGALSHMQTIVDDGENIVGLLSVMRVTVSRDGRFVYTSGGRFGHLDAVCVFHLRHGTLNLLQTLSGGDLPAEFGGGNEIVLSPDQREVSVACTGSDTVVRFRRNRETGRLTVIGSEASGPADNPGPAGLCWSANDRFLHVADEESGAIVTFRKKAR